MENNPGQATRKAMNLFFILFLGIGSLLAGSVALFYRAELNTFLSEIKTQEKYALIRQNKAIRDKFDGIVGDILFLSRQNELLTYLELENTQVENEIQAEYISMSQAKKIYDQIRYLDASGMERVRVNFAEGKPISVPQEKLQNKFNRYYFTDTMILGKKEIFVSPLDLNVEQGQVEQPLKPMIRFGTPVFDTNGVKRGIVLLNYLAVNLLNFLETEQAAGDSVNMLLNTEGYWLLHPEKEKEWGFMFKERAGISFTLTYPKEWQMIHEQGSGQVQTQNGLFTFSTIYPLREGFRSSSGSGEPYKPSVKNLDPSEYFWVLVSHIPSEVMSSHTRSLLVRLFTIGAVLFLLISYGAWQLALAITKRRIYQAQLVELALYDSLTGLPNRKFFFDRLEEGVFHTNRYGRRLGLLYIDLDSFKAVNDNMGHQAGDELLVKVGATLKGILRKSDTVARLGGDEFAIILLEIKEVEDVKLVGEKVVAAMCQPFQLKGGTARIGASVGAAIFPDHVDKMDELIKHADTAMYKAKAEGKNTCVMAFKD